MDSYSSQVDTSLKQDRSKHKPLAAIFVFVVEVCLLIYVYRYDMAGLIVRPDDTHFCRQIFNSMALCTTLARTPPLILLLIIILGYLRLLQPQRVSYAYLTEKVISCNQPKFWLAVNLLGFALILAPYFLFLTDMPDNVLALSGALLWLTGTAAFISGLIFWLLPMRAIYALVNWKVVAGIICILALPVLDLLIADTLWLETSLQKATTELAIFFLELFGQTVYWDRDILLATPNFWVQIGYSCAGIAGIAFSAGAMAGYILWMRSDLRVGRALATVPVIALLSWTLNSLRIALLIMVGEHISPTLAIEGFHSYAGWISFTILTGAMVFVVDRTPWFQEESAPARERIAVPIWKDPIAAQILPLTVFLFSSLVVGAFFDPPAQGYPLRILLTSVCLLVFLPSVSANLKWKVDPLAVGAGIFIAVMWLLGQPDAKGTLGDVVPGLTGIVLAAWVVIRILGTSVIVPIVEELFFRGYLLGRLQIGGRYAPFIALLTTSALFAALHGNLVLAFLAGLIFGALVLRSGRVIDAIYAHAVANLLIAIFALLTNNWAVI